jgi:hypothetical protein
MQFKGRSQISPVAVLIARAQTGGETALEKRGVAVTASTLLVLLALFSMPCVADEVTNLSPPAVWDTSARVTTGFGYRDNILRTSIAAESGTFFNTAADASFIRLADNDAYLSFFILADDTRYLDVPSVAYEQFFSGTAQAVMPVGPRDELGGQFSYLYQHQVVDLSESGTALTRMLVDGHSYTLRPHWRRTLGGGWAVRVEVSGLRQLYDGDLSDYWEAAAEGRLIRTYGNRSEFSIIGQSKHIRYDSREKADRFGMAIANTDLASLQNEIGCEWRHNWDKARQWQTASRFSYMVNQDNGSGFFDYDRLLLKQQLRWKNSRWEVKTNARFSWYNYPVKRMGAESLERSSMLFDARVERRLGQRWLTYLFAEREWSTSNDLRDRYKTWMAGGGVGFEF